MRTNAFEFMIVDSRDKLTVFSSFLDNLKICQGRFTRFNIGQNYIKWVLFWHLFLHVRLKYIDLFFLSLFFVMYADKMQSQFRVKNNFRNVNE